MSSTTVHEDALLIQRNLLAFKKRHDADSSTIKQLRIQISQLQEALRKLQEESSGLSSDARSNLEEAVSYADEQVRLVPVTIINAMKRATLSPITFSPATVSALEAVDFAESQILESYENSESHYRKDHAFLVRLAERTEAVKQRLRSAQGSSILPSNSKLDVILAPSQPPLIVTPTQRFSSPQTPRTSMVIVSPSASSAPASVAVSAPARSPVSTPPVPMAVVASELPVVAVAAAEVVLATELTPKLAVPPTDPLVISSVLETTGGAQQQVSPVASEADAASGAETVASAVTITAAPLEPVPLGSQSDDTVLPLNAVADSAAMGTYSGIATSPSPVPQDATATVELETIVSPGGEAVLTRSEAIIAEEEVSVGSAPDLVHRKDEVKIDVLENSHPDAVSIDADTTPQSIEPVPDVVLAVDTVEIASSGEQFTTDVPITAVVEVADQLPIADNSTLAPSTNPLPVDESPRAAILTEAVTAAVASTVLDTATTQREPETIPTSASVTTSTSSASYSVNVTQSASTAVSISGTTTVLNPLRRGSGVFRRQSASMSSPAISVVIPISPAPVAVSASSSPVGTSRVYSSPRRRSVSYISQTAEGVAVVPPTTAAPAPLFTTNSLTPPVVNSRSTSPNASARSVNSSPVRRSSLADGMLPLPPAPVVEPEVRRYSSPVLEQRSRSSTFSGISAGEVLQLQTELHKHTEASPKWEDEQPVLLNVVGKDFTSLMEALAAEANIDTSRLFDAALPVRIVPITERIAAYRNKPNRPYSPPPQRPQRSLRTPSPEQVDAETFAELLRSHASTALPAERDRSTSAFASAPPTVELRSRLSFISRPKLGRTMTVAATSNGSAKLGNRMTLVPSTGAKKVSVAGVRLSMPVKPILPVVVVKNPLFRRSTRPQPAAA
eukprot:TRINITY_DN1263_c0_g2_i1.p1 TRINITY_DN1263_c0_g2~~TRINITY_DN1263_c0_g2_i1.p1  ORF type:complete len:903 (-),score=162.45 TRINITY_DN1263_c0_g2_i1:1358-4066(-)